MSEEQSKVGRSSNRKGKKYESRIVSLLNKFTGAKFRRVPNSGGFNKTGGQVILEHIFSGDVICEDKRFKFSIEAKNRKDISLPAVLKNAETASLTKYWKQCCDDAYSNNLKPMMFFKPNFGDDWVCIAYEDMIQFNIDKSSHITIKLNLELPDIVMYNWIGFTKIVNPLELFCD